MRKIILLLLITLFFSNSTQLENYIIEPYQMRTFKDPSACVCLKLHADTKKESNPFYLTISADKQNEVKMDKDIYYKFKNSCDNLDACKEDTYKNLTINNNRNQDLTTTNSFYYEYIFNLDDNNHKALYIQYREFTGTEINIQYAPFSGASVLITFLVISFILDV